MSKQKDGLSEFMDSERSLYLWIVDTLAHEYGWSIEYIQHLQLPTIFGLIKTIRKRKDTEDQINQLNIAKGFSGKLSSNYNKAPKASKSERNAQEVENLQKLSKMLNIPVKAKGGGK